MGIRPNKAIGWGITISGAKLNEQAVDNILDQKHLSYAGLFDYIAENDLMKQHRKHSAYFSKDKFVELDKNKTLFNYVEIISKNYDSEVDFEEEEWTIIFYPMVLSALAFHDGCEEFKEGSTPFIYAEIEQFFPESMEKLNTVSYTFETPPFPSEYSVIHNNGEKTAQNFRLLEDRTISSEVKRCLIAEQNDEFLEIYAKMFGFDNVDELKKAYTLAPDEEVFAFAQYSNVFKNEENPYELIPTVAYYWS